MSFVRYIAAPPTIGLSSFIPIICAETLADPTTAITANAKIPANNFFIAPSEFWFLFLLGTVSLCMRFRSRERDGFRTLKLFGSGPCEQCVQFFFYQAVTES